MKPSTIITSLLVCAFCVGTAHAKGHGHKAPVDQFKKLDTDRNGTLSMQEFSAGGKGNSSSAFARADKNNDGKLDRYEFSLLHKKKH